MDPRTEEPPAVRDSPMWLSHHFADEYDRCIVVRGKRVCRRCAVLYPLALVAAVALGLGVKWPDRLDPWFLWLLPLPAVLEFVGEQLRLFEHSARRLVALTVPLAVGCGALYVRYLEEPGDDLVWNVVLSYLGICIAAWFVRAFFPRR